MKHVLCLRSVFVLLLAGLMACEPAEKKENSAPPAPPADKDPVTVPNDLPVSESDLQLFTLPTPVQTAAVMKAADFEFNESLLVPLDEFESTNDLRAVHLGMYLTDLGYAGLFNQRQVALLYLKKTAELKNELGIASTNDAIIAQRFEENIDNSDSLSKLILQSYTEAHLHFQNQEQENVGLLILAGCYVEGLYLSVNSNPSAQDQDYQNLMAQQKLFLNSLLSLLANFHYDGEALELTDKLKELKEAFKDVKVTYQLTSEGKSQQMGGQITEVTAGQVRAKVSNIRNQILN